MRKALIISELFLLFYFILLIFTYWDTNEWNLFYNYMIDNIQLYIKSGLIDYNKKNLKNRKLMIAFDDDKISNFCTNICIEILKEKKNLSSQEILDRYKKRNLTNLTTIKKEFKNTVNTVI